MSVKLKTYFSYLLIFVIGYFSYQDCLENQITNLDEHQLIINKFDDLKSQGWFTFFQDDVFGNGTSPFYRPILNWTLKIDAERTEDLNKLWPFFQTNILIHILNCLLFFLLCNLIFKDSLAVNLFGTILFCLLPINIPAISWIPGRNDSLLLLFSLFYFLSLHEVKAKSNYIYVIPALISVFLILFTKESGLVIVVSGLILFRFWKFSKKTVIILITGVITFMSLYLFLRFKYISSEELNFSVISWGIIYRYKIFLDSLSHIMIPYDIVTFKNITDYTISYLGLITIIIIVGSAFLLVKKKRNVVILFLTGLCILSPVILRNDIIYHRAYISSVIIVFILIISLNKLCKLYPKGRYIILPLLILLSLVYFKSNRNILPDYNNPLSFWKAATSASPNSPKAHYEMGYVYQLSGNFQQAEKYYLKTLSINTNEINARNNLAVIKKNQGKYQEALKLYHGELQVNEDSAFVLENIGNLFYVINQWGSAINYYERCLAIEPERYDCYERLIISCLNNNNNRKANFYFNKLGKSASVWIKNEKLINYLNSLNEIE